jgi:ABC-type Fe3+/spermidine/putrescine transport system ATPase subunit
MGDAAVELIEVRKEFGGDVVAVDSLDLTIEDGEFFSLLALRDVARRRPCA